jgi:hypothetical protein
MTIKRQTLLAGLTVALVLIALPAFPWQGAHQVRDLAWNLSSQADHAWNALQGSRITELIPGARNSGTSELVNAVQDFDRDAKEFAQRTDNTVSPDQLRRQANRLMREATRINELMDQANVSERFRQEWTNVDNTMQNLAGNLNMAYGRGRELPRGEYGNKGSYGGYSGGYNGPGGYGNSGGHIRWQGTVDGSDLIKVRGDRVWTQHMSANPVQDATFDISAPLPRANVNVAIRQLQGRGRVQLVEEPSPENNYTATIRIDDPQPGPDFYAFELTW